MLAPLVLTLHFQAGGQMHNSHAALSLVHMLAPGPAGPHGFLPHVLVPIDLDLLLVAHFRRDIHGRETRLPLRLCVVRADADQPMNASLALEVAVSIRTANGDGR